MLNINLNLMNLGAPPIIRLTSLVGEGELGEFSGEIQQYMSQEG